MLPPDPHGLDLRIEALARASRSLGDFVARDPASRELIAREEPLPDLAGYIARMEEAFGEGGMSALRVAKRRSLAQVAARDLAGELDITEVGRRLSDIADACLRVTNSFLSDGALGILAMGKLGGGELNYSSDIDLIFVGPSETTPAAEALLRELGGSTPEGRAFRIDTNLRPEGRSGPLVRSVEAMLEHYRRHADSWEHQALLKMRPVDGGGANETYSRTRPIVFPPEVSPERVAAVRAMKERVERHSVVASRRARTDQSLDVKLGPGGIRDIEFSVQLLQLVHGCSDPDVRSANTLEGLSSLVDRGYVAEQDGAGLAVAYRWLRTVEHRLQLWQERQVHHLPSAPDDRARLARVMGFRDTPAASAVDRFDAAHHSVLADVRNRFERLFYRPMIESLADPAGARMSSEALQDRLRVLGFRDAERAARTLDGLVSGTTRRAKVFRVLTPAMLRFLASAPRPDEGLLSFLELGEAMESRGDILGALRDNPPALALLAAVLGSGRLLGTVLAHVPEEIGALAQQAGPAENKDRHRLLQEAHASLRWREPAQRFDGLRRFKRRELVRLAVADIAGADDVMATARGLSDLADACLEAALAEAEGFAVVGMGKLGGRELNYSSDIDVVFVCDDHSLGDKIATELIAAIGEVTPEGQAFRIDVGLRPEGRNGPLVRTPASYERYYAQHARPWERLALIKARHAAGSSEVAASLLAIAEEAVFSVAPRQDDVGEIRHLKARMERERIPRGTDPKMHLKLGPGGLADIEFAAQLLQLGHGHDIEALRWLATLDALAVAAELGLIERDQADRLCDTYRFLMKLRNRLFFQFGRPTDVLPAKPEDLEAAGKAMGFIEQPRQELEEMYLRLTRRARRIAEPLIYG